MDSFTRAVFEAVYASPRQRRLRLAVGTLLAFKHALRGLFFSWPLYLLAAAGLALPGAWSSLFLLLLAPAVWVSGTILLKGWREDYNQQVRRRLLKRVGFRITSN